MNATDADDTSEGKAVGPTGMTAYLESILREVFPSSYVLSSDA